jgi:hypothetical protein
MKKLMVLASALAAAVFSTSAAQADVSVSGSYGFHAITGKNVIGGNSGSDDDTTTSGTAFMQGGGVSFAMSTTTAGGMTVSASAGITLDSNDAANTTAATGLSAVTFAADGFSLTAGEIDIPAGGGTGEVGFVASAVVDNGGYSQSGIATGIANTEGYGFIASTSVGAASVSFGYMLDYANSGVNNAETQSGDYASGISVSLPMGSSTVTLGTASQSGTKDESTAGIAASMPLGAYTVKVGYEATDESTDSSSMSGAISGSLDADTSWAVGYTSGEQGTSSSTMTEAKLTRSLGGGVSVYAELQNSSGTTTGTAGTNLAVGTTVAF